MSRVGSRKVICRNADLSGVGASNSRFQVSSTNPRWSALEVHPGCVEFSDYLKFMFVQVRGTVSRAAQLNPRPESRHVLSGV